MSGILQKFKRTVLCITLLCPVAFATCTVPVISSPLGTSDATGQIATFTWTTNVPTITNLAYGPGQAGAGIFVAPSDPTGVTSHQVIVSGLNPGSPYNFAIQAITVDAGSPCPGYTGFKVFGGEGSGNVFTMHAPPVGSYDYKLTLGGPSRVTQGYKVSLGLAPIGLVSQAGVPANNAQKVVLTGLPNFTSIRWLDPQDFGQAGTVSTTTLPDDTLTWYTTEGEEILLTTNVGGTTTPGVYTLTATGSGPGGIPTRTTTFSLTVDAVATPYGIAVTPGTPSSYPPIPHLADWAANGVLYRTYNTAQDLDISPRTVRANDASNLCPVNVGITKCSWFYDGCRGANSLNQYNNDFTDHQMCDNIKAVYRDGYVIPNNGAIHPVLPFTIGAYDDYLRTGDALDLTWIDDLDKNTYSPLQGNMIPVWYLQRETAWALDTDTSEYLLGRSQTRFGKNTAYWMEYHYEKVLGQLQQICQPGTPTQYFEPFMVGLQADSAIRHYELVAHDPRVPALLKCVANYLWTNEWNVVTGDPGAFAYDINWAQFNNFSSSNVQLNLLLAPIWAWLFRYYGDATFQTQGDEIFQHGVLNDGPTNIGPSFMGSGNAYPGGSPGKFWAQNYFWSYFYVVWRSAPSAAASVTPVSVNFGNQKTSVTSAAQIVTLSNIGTGTMTLTSELLTTGTQFAISANTCGGTLAAATSCTVSLTCTPTTTGLKSDTLTFLNSAPSSPQTVALSCTGTASIVNLLPTSLGFGSQQAGTSSATQAITLTNTGSATLGSMSNTITGTNASDFSKTTTCSTTLTASSACTATVTFSPATVGAKTAAVTFTNDASDSPQTVNLTGTGTGTAVQLSPLGGLNFLTQIINTLQSKDITVTNTGPNPLHISAISLTGDASYTKTSSCGTPPTTLATSTSCSVSITFLPTIVGAKSGTLTMADDAPDSPQSLPLSGAGGVDTDATIIHIGAGAMRIGVGSVR